MKRYERFADEIAELICDGVLAPESEVGQKSISVETRGRLGVNAPMVVAHFCP